MEVGVVARNSSRLSGECHEIRDLLSADSRHLLTIDSHHRRTLGDKRPTEKAAKFEIPTVLNIRKIINSMIIEQMLNKHHKKCIVRRPAGEESAAVDISSL